MRNYHLSQEDLALWIEAMENDQVSSLPDNLRRHVSRCHKCRNLVVEHSGILLVDDVMKPFPGSMLKDIPVMGRKRIFLAAAAIILLLLLPCAGIILLLNMSKDNDSALFGKYFTPYPDMITVKNLSFRSDNTQDFLEGMTFYSLGDYDSAIYHFNICLSHDIGGDTVAFYKGIASLASGKTIDSAITVFNSLIRKKSPFSNRSEWYLALAYLKEGKPEEASVHLRKIPATDKELSAKVSSLLIEL